MTLDLQARVDAAQASVDRLTQLMSQAGSLADLIAAESALAERQATLESYQQQLKYYDEQVAMSTLTVTLTEPSKPWRRTRPGSATVWPRDGTPGRAVNGIVIAIGFLMPWLLMLLLVDWSRGVGRSVRLSPSAGRADAPKTPRSVAPDAERTRTTDVPEQRLIIAPARMRATSLCAGTVGGRLGTTNKEVAMSSTVARITTISARSSESFDHAIREGWSVRMPRLRNVSGAWVKDQKVECSDGVITSFHVVLEVVFVLD